MPKVDVMLNCLLSYFNQYDEPGIHAMYAGLAVNRNTYQWICQNQPDNGDVMAHDAALYAMGKGPKPEWITQGGL